LTCSLSNSYFFSIKILLVNYILSVLEEYLARFCLFTVEL